MNNETPAAVILTDTQKGVLAVIYNTPTPETAFYTTTGNQALVTARNILERLGMIQVGGNRAVLTPIGRDAVIANNITDTTGELTEEGTALIDAVSAMLKTKTNEAFVLLSTLID
jgi:hypothetical protein